MGITKLISEHRYGIAIAFLIGFIFLLPHLLMPLLQQEGVNYTPLVVRDVGGRAVDEKLYLGYVHEVIEGHIIPRSTAWEWQDKAILSHPGPVPAIILGAMGLALGGIKQTYIISFFIFPFLGSLLIYCIAFRLTANKRISCAAAPLLYFPMTYIKLFLTTDTTSPMGYFSRFYPVLFNFIIFALALLFLLLLLQKKEWKYAFLSGIFGGLLFFTYFYYWSYYVIVVCIFSAVAVLFLRKKVDLRKILVFFTIVIFFWTIYFLLFAHHNVSEKSDMLLRYTGAKLTHAPNYVYSMLLLIIIISYVYFIYHHYFRSQQKEELPWENFLFLLTLLISSFFIVNIQVVTGFTLLQRQWIHAVIWPVLILTGIYTLSFWLPKIKRKRVAWEKIIPLIVTLFLLFFGLVWHISFAATMFPYYSLPDYQEKTFTWLNKNTQPDEVVLSLSSDMILLIPVHTSNQNFIPSARGEPIPISEIVMRRLIANKLLNVSADKFVFLDNPCATNEAIVQQNLKEGKTEFNYSRFEETNSHLITFEAFFANAGCSVPPEFKEKIKATYQDLPTEVDELTSVFKVDYIIIGPYERQLMQADLSTFATVKYQDEDVTIYEVLEP